MSLPEKFTIRAYGLWLDNGNLLCTREYFEEAHAMFKFPGGGLEFGEGLLDCLKREFLEETGVEIDQPELFYINDFYQQSRFNPADQLISVYFKVTARELPIVLYRQEIRENKPYHVHLHWMPVQDLNTEDLTFPIDRMVLEKLKKEWI